MRKSGNGTARTNGGAGLAASALFHLLVFLALGLALRNTPLFAISPTIEMRLVRLVASPTPATPPPPRPARASATSPAPPLVPHLTPLAPPVVAPAPVVPPTAQPTQNADAFHGALRLTLGCAHPDAVKLTAAERDACRRMTARTHNAAPSFGALSEHMRAQVPRDDAERAYRDSTSTRDYPGAHCLLNETCTPDTPTEAPQPLKEDCPWAWCHTVGR
jgi:hypothetical protein